MLFLKCFLVYSNKHFLHGCYIQRQYKRPSYQHKKRLLRQVPQAVHTRSWKQKQKRQFVHLRFRKFIPKVLPEVTRSIWKRLRWLQALHWQLYEEKIGKVEAEALAKVGRGVFRVQRSYEDDGQCKVDKNF